MATAKRDQLIQEAEKLAAKGKLDAAVAQFEKALQQGPPDGVLLNRLGDLLLKANRVEEAVTAYQKAADAYAAQGFTLKAVAAEKKANRADPQKANTYERLASFYYTLNMPVEGRQQLLTLADWYLRGKNVGEAVRIYRRLAELEPGNFAVRAKLVDLLAGQGDLAAASAEAEQLGLVLVSRGHLDEAVKLLERSREMGLEPGKFGPALLEALVIGGRLPTGVELARKWEGSEVPADLAVAMARVLVEAGDLGKAKALLEQVLPQVGERTEVVQLYGDILLRVGEGEAAKEKLLPTVDRLLASGDVDRAGNLLKRLLKADPRDIEVLERGLKVFDRRADPEFFSVLEAALADAYFQRGRRQEAADLYMELAEREPGNAFFQQRLQELGVRPRAAEILRRPQREAEPAPPAESSPLGSAAEGEVLVDIPIEVELAPEEPEGAALESASQEGSGTGPQASVEELYTEAMVLAKYGLTDKALAHLQQLLALNPSHAKGLELLASLGGSLEVVEEEAHELTSAPPPEEAAPAEKAVWGIDLVVSPVPPPRSPLLSSTPPPAKSSVHPGLEDLEALLGLTPRQPLTRSKSAAFSEGQQPVSTAPSPESAPPIVGGKAAQDRAGAEAVHSQFVVPQFEIPQASPPSPPEEPVELVELSGELLEPTPEQVSELDFLLEQGLVEQAKETFQKLAASFPESEVLTQRAAKLAELSAHIPGAVEHSTEELFAEEQGFFNLAAELEKELEEDEQKQLVAEARGEGVQEESIEELFKKFQQRVSEQLGEEDYATHFDLGLAYREMGLLDEAIGEFQLVLKSPEMALDAMSLIASCYLDKGLPEEAASWFEKALQVPDLPADAELGLKYELGRAWEQAGNVSSALAYYAEVLAVNPGYRDVVDRVTRLQTATN